MAVSIAEPPPTATIASKGPSVRAKAMASSNDASVGSTRTRSYVVTSRPRERIASAIRSGCPVAATPGSVTRSTRRASPRHSFWTSQPISVLAPRPNFSPGAA